MAVGIRCKSFFCVVQSQINIEQSRISTKIAPDGGRFVGYRISGSARGIGISVLRLVMRELGLASPHMADLARKRYFAVDSRSRRVNVF